MTLVLIVITYYDNRNRGKIVSKLHIMNKNNKNKIIIGKIPIKITDVNLGANSFQENREKGRK